ncbi:hypothetical protein MKJ04_16750 [Pontibacter sp. E15-1]|uniref:hypothetical protein n=1 Tax=Pontibacter sp. E15-1 TaxID=2919918 RepID=UPI001F4F2822|nr:hypothetical protein [Pontibacter sp. E15-1]MCJ8166496.1 hypothetical protein [Pontibacter sp. E15-1]
MKKALLLFSMVLVLTPVLSYGQNRQVEGVEAVKLPCFAANNTIEFHLSSGLKKGKTYWFGEGFAQAYTSETGAQLVVICSSKYRTPALQGKHYVVTSQDGKKREGKIRKTDYLWREEDFFGFIVYYTKVNEYEKELFDSLIDQIVALIKKE